MSITSYAQNFEDVMLWRALGYIPNGFYIDVGAQHPVNDSVSKAFYEHGWRGVHVEATPAYATLVRADRPDELVLQVALSDKPGSINFYEIPETGLSTGDLAIAEHHRSQGYKVLETVVPCITLADVFEQVGDRDIHWLKIDVEGMEAQVLTGWGSSPARPWVLVVESTYPNSQVETHQKWESMLLARGYIHTYFDGLSRFYVLADRLDLAQRFKTPPNIFDGFSLAASVPYNGPIREILQQNEQSHRNQLAESEKITDQRLHTAQQALQQQQQEHAQRERLLVDKNSQTKLEQQTLLRTVAQREQEVSNQLLTYQLQAAQELAALASRHHAQEQTLQHEHAEREHVLHQQQHALHSQHSAREQARGQQIEVEKQERRKHEQALLEQANQARQEVENLLRTQAQREQAVAEKLEAVRSQAAQESAVLTRSLTQQQHALHSQHNARVQALSQQIEAEKQERRKREQALLEQASQARQEVDNLLRTQAQREREILAQLLAVQQQATQEKAALARSHAENVRELGRQQAQREKVLAQQLHAHQQELRNLQNGRAKREQEVLVQLLASQQQAAQEKADLLQKQSEQERALHRQHSEREAALTQQLQELGQVLLQQQEDWAQLEQALNHQIATLQNETQTLHQAQQLQAQQHGLELSTQHDEHARLLETCAALETQLQAEMQSGQQASRHLRQLLAEVQHSLEMTHVSFSWRITAPLRKLAGLFTSNKNPPPAPFKLSEPALPEPTQPVATEPSPISVNQASLEPTMPPLAQATSSNIVTNASTLPELLAHNDQNFIQCTYRTLLGREVDAEGMSYYLGQLRIGFSKMRIITQLFMSLEGKRYTAKLPGLEVAVRNYQREQMPLIGNIFRKFSGGEGNSSTERRLRSIENQIASFNSSSKSSFEKMELALADLNNWTTQQTQPTNKILKVNTMSSPYIESQNTIEQSPADNSKKLSPRAKSIYSQLATATNNYAWRIV